MLRRRTLACLLTLLLVTAPAVRADQVDDYVKARITQFRLPGLAVAVLKGGEIVKATGYGSADLTRSTPVTVDTVFKIGSVSKQFIAAAIMALVQDRRLSVEDPVIRYLPDAPPSWQPITVRHLLTHTAGLARESPRFNPMEAMPDIDAIRAVYPLPLLFVPGSRWTYSNAGYYVLAEIVTRVSGRPWTQFVQERIFTPAGMTSTAPTNATQIPNRAAGYTGNDNGRRADEWVALRPSGAFLSTVVNLARWERVLRTNAVLAETTRRDMWARTRLNDGTTADYGFGWHVETLFGGPAIWHGGGLPGFSAHYLRCLDADLAVIVLTNGDDVDLPDIARGIARHYLPSTPSQ